MIPSIAHRNTERVRFTGFRFIADSLSITTQLGSLKKLFCVRVYNFCCLYINLPTTTLAFESGKRQIVDGIFYQLKSV